ncbi:hypothetical protein BH10PLA2_BH10PLA2_27970 [soil metagenome]
MLGDLFFPLLFPLLLVPLVLGFLEGLAVGALVRAFMGRIRMYKVWLIAWLFFGFGAAVLGNWLRYRNLW